MLACATQFDRCHGRRVLRRAGDAPRGSRNKAVALRLVPCVAGALWHLARAFGDIWIWAHNWLARAGRSNRGTVQSNAKYYSSGFLYFLHSNFLNLNFYVHPGGQIQALQGIHRLG